MTDCHDCAQERWFCDVRMGSGQVEQRMVLFPNGIGYESRCVWRDQYGKITEITPWTDNGIRLTWS